MSKLLMLLLASIFALGAGCKTSKEEGAEQKGILGIEINPPPPEFLLGKTFKSKSGKFISFDKKDYKFTALEGMARNSDTGTYSVRFNYPWPQRKKITDRVLLMWTGYSSKQMEFYFLPVDESDASSDPRKDHSVMIDPTYTAPPEDAYYYLVKK